MKSSAFQIILLAVFGAMAVAAVLIFSIAVGGGNKKAIGPVVIWGTLNKTAFSAVLRKAADADPALNQVSYVQKDPATYENTLTQALASGTGPDLFLLADNYAYKDAGEAVIIPSSALSPTQFQNTFADAATPFITPAGIVGVPMLMDPLVLYWNKDMLASAGYSAPPQYWDQLFNMASTITVRSDSGTISKSAIALGEYSNVNHAKAIVATLIMQAGGSITQYDKSQNLRSALILKGGSASQATPSALRFFTEFSDPSKNDYTWNRALPEAQKAFAAGDLALYIGYASEQSAIEAQNPNLNFAVAPLPQIRNASRTLDTSRVYALAASRAGKHTSSALAVASALIDSSNAAAFSQAYGLPSARRDLLSAKTTGNMETFRRMAIASYGWVDPNPAETDTIFQGMIDNVTSGAQLLNDAISRADQELNQYLSKNQKNPQ